MSILRTALTERDLLKTFLFFILFYCCTTVTKALIGPQYWGSKKTLRTQSLEYVASYPACNMLDSGEVIMSDSDFVGVPFSCVTLISSRTGSETLFPEFTPPPDII